MAKYEIRICETISQNVLVVHPFLEDTTAEAKAKAYLYARVECAKLPDGEYACTLYSEGSILKRKKIVDGMPVISFRVENGLASLQEVKVLFGGEAAAVNKLAMISESLNRLAQLAMAGSDIHKAFSDAVVCTQQTLASLVQSYNPEYIKSEDVTNLKNVIKEECKLESLAYQAYGNDNEGLYCSAAAKACTSIQLTLVIVLNNVPTLVG